MSSYCCVFLAGLDFFSTSECCFDGRIELAFVDDLQRDPRANARGQRAETALHPDPPRLHATARSSGCEFSIMHSMAGSDHFLGDPPGEVNDRVGLRKALVMQINIYSFESYNSQTRGMYINLQNTIYTCLCIFFHSLKVTNKSICIQNLTT